MTTFAVNRALWALLMMRLFSKIISTIFHPALSLVYLYFILLYANPYLFPADHDKLFVFVVIYTLVYPVIGVLLLRATGLIGDLSMPRKQDRIAPYIISIMFLLWFFANINKNPNFPQEYSILVLGACIGTCLSFFVNIWDKVSFHACAAAFLVTSLILIAQVFSDGYFLWKSTDTLYKIPLSYFVIGSIAIAGAVAMARLHLKAHNINQIMGGTLIGIISPIIAMRIIDYVS